MLISGVEVTTAHVLLGLKFSWPNWRSGFRILTAVPDDDRNIFKFTAAFHWGVWGCLAATAIIISFIVTGMELMTYGNRANRKGLRGWAWYCMAQMVNVPTHVGDPRTFAGKVLIGGYCWLILIMMHLFTGAQFWPTGKKP